jgi:hypothetical protein
MCKFSIIIIVAIILLIIDTYMKFNGTYRYNIELGILSLSILLYTIYCSYTKDMGLLSLSFLLALTFAIVYESVVKRNIDVMYILIIVLIFALPRYNLDDGINFQL